MTLVAEIKKVFDGTTANTKAVLTEEEAKQFADDIVDQSSIFKKAKVIKMITEKYTVDRISLADDVAHPAVAGTALASNKYATTSNAGSVVLQPQEYIATVKINDNELETNIEGMSFEDHFMSMLIKQLANQLERVALYAKKKDVVTTLYDMFEGWIAKGKRLGNVTDFSVGYADRYIDKNKLSVIAKSIPTKFLPTTDAFVMHEFLGTDYEDLYIQSANRVPTDRANNKPFVFANWIKTDNPVPTGSATTISSDVTAGDTTINLTSGAIVAVGDTIVFAYGKPKEFSAKVLTKVTNTITIDVASPYALESTDANENSAYKATLDGADVLLTGYDNLLMGIGRDVTIEFERSARERATYAVVTGKIDFNVMWEKALGVGKGLKVR